jgi:hypothetical protein
LSHAHLEGWISTYAFLRLPNWFKEGLAVMASGGGGAEFVSVEEARAAIKRHEHIAIDDTGSLWNLAEIRFERAPSGATPSHATVMAYRQAGMFVSCLHDTDGPGFARMMNAILDGRPFVQAVDAGYHQDVHSLWQKFAQRFRVVQWLLFDNVFNPDRKAANAFAGGVVNRVGDGRLDARRAQHADAFDTTRQMRVVFFNHCNVELRNVGMDRDQVVGETVADNVT